MKQTMILVMAVLQSVMVVGQIANRFDVVIHELMADPSPVMGLPAYEFVELRNVSKTAFNLRNWKLSDGSSTATINSNYLLKADSFVIVCPNAAVQALSVYGPVIGVANFPSLNNEGDVISLSSAEGRIIHAVEYDVGWYNNAVKREGGWTLEMIDALNPCQGEGNWTASGDAAGGTPGRRNAVEGIQKDLQPPALLRTFAIDSTTIAVLFDEPMDSALAANIQHYRLDKGLNVSTALPASPLFRLVTLTTNLPLRANEVYNVVVSGVSDCAGNTMGMMNAARAGLPRTPLEKDLVINEVLFNPRAGEPDFVELYNRSNNILDAAALQIASRNLSGVLSTPQRISETSFLIFPGDYLVISADKLRVPASVFVPAGFPSMPDDKGTVVVLSNQGIIIDELSYDERWHFPLVTAHEGVALERIDVNAPTQSRDNWTSAASDAGFATPGRLNSQSRTPNSFRENTTVSPRIFSPDNDGWDDHCFIHYRFASPGYVANISIFDAGGYLVRNLVQSATLSRQGFFRWDGLDNAGKPLPMGVYIILTEVFNLEGRTVKFKNPVTLARRF